MSRPVACVAAVLLLTTAGTASAAPAGTTAPAVAAELAPLPLAPGSVTTTLYRGAQDDDALVRRGTGDGPNQLVSIGLPPQGGADDEGDSFAGYSGFGTDLVLQDDGNLVGYETSTGRVLFATGTTTGTTFVYQQDGNAVLYDANGVALFATGTAGDTRGVQMYAYGDGRIVIKDNNPDHGVSPTVSDDSRVIASFGPRVVASPGVLIGAASSDDEHYQLVVQGDGNVVAYDTSTGTPIWSTGTAGVGPVRFVAQQDGNLVVYSDRTGAAVWSSGTRGAPDYYDLVVQDDGNVVLYLTDFLQRVLPFWASNTAR